MSAGHDALRVLGQLNPKFHPDPDVVEGPLENQFTGGPREVQGAGGTSYAISKPVLEYIADLPASEWTAAESGCGYSTVVLANVFGTHICVNPDLASNRLVREYIERHCGVTGLRQVEKSSDQGLPELVTERVRIELGLIDGNHSHPFPIIDFHYMDRMLAVGGVLLVDNTEIEAVQELTDYLDVEPAYDLERLIGNCAVYRKVGERAFGWKTQVLRRAPKDTHAARRELSLLRMEVAPELRAALSGATPLPEPPGAQRDRGSAAGPGPKARPRPRGIGLVRRRARQLAKWYASPSGALAGLSLALLGIGVALPDLWRLIAVVGVALLAAFLPYRFMREQRRNDARLTWIRDEMVARIGAQVDHATRRTDDLFARQSAAATALDDRITSITEHMSHELTLVRNEASEAAATVAGRLDDFVAQLTPSRRFTAAKPGDRGLVELAIRDATETLRPRDPTG